MVNAIECLYLVYCIGRYSAYHKYIRCSLELKTSSFSEKKHNAIITIEAYVVENRQHYSPYFLKFFEELDCRSYTWCITRFIRIDAYSPTFGRMIFLQSEKLMKWIWSVCQYLQTDSSYLRVCPPTY